jgi:hypothetical protein
MKVGDMVRAKVNPARGWSPGIIVDFEWVHDELESESIHYPIVLWSTGQSNRVIREFIEVINESR